MSDNEHIAHQETGGHSHTHGDHTHGDHTHGSVTSNSPEETLALLSYMLSHNEHHTEELHEIAHLVPERAAELLHDAVSDYTRGNQKLAEAVSALKEG